MRQCFPKPIKPRTSHPGWITVHSAYYQLLTNGNRNWPTVTNFPEHSSESYGHPIEALHMEFSPPDRAYVILIIDLHWLIKYVSDFTIQPLISSTRVPMLHYQLGSIVLVGNMLSMKSGPEASAAAPKRYSTTARKACNALSLPLSFLRTTAMA
jgi:hypothetical protein